MKIAHLTTVDLSLRFLVLPQLEAVVEMGGESIGISAPGPWVEQVEQRGVRHVPLASSTRGIDWRSDLRSMWELWRVLRRERPDILHTHNPKPGVYGRILGRLAGVPVVINTVHGLYATEDDPWPKRLVVYLLEAVASRFSDLELYQNPEDLDLMTRLHVVPGHKAVLLGNGVDLGRFDASRFAPDDRTSVRKDFGVGDDTPVIGIVGRLVAEKGYPELFEAFEELRDHARLVVVGPDDPSKDDALDRAVIERAQASGVVFLCMRDDVDRLYRGFDLFVLPSHREGFPRAAMEAAASGLPIVATDIRGCRQVVENGMNGLLVPVLDPAALAAALESLVGDPGLRARLGRASADKARREFDERDVVAIVSEAHRSVWESKVGEWPLAARTVDGDIGYGPAQVDDAAAVARLHCAGIRTGFLSSLGPGFLRHLYRSIIESPHGVVLVARDDRGGVVGFVAGTEDTSAVYRDFLLSSDAVRASISAIGKAFLPSVWRRVIETLRYGAGVEDDVAPELLAMAVSAEARGQGVGLALGLRLMQWFEDRGVPAAQVVVSEANDAAIALYRRLGFGDERRISVHEESPSLVMTWSP